MIKDREQNPIIGDTIRLRLFSYSSNTRAEVYEVECVRIYFLDQDQRSEDNPDGRILMDTIPGTDVDNPSTGEYLVSLVTSETSYRVGSYIDRWEVKFEPQDARSGIIENNFTIYRDLWYTSSKPIIYDMGFTFAPYKMVQGTKKHLRVDVDVYAPDNSTIDNYYYYLNTLADIQIKIVQDDGDGYDPDVPANNIILNWTSVQWREGTSGYYLLDTSVDPRPSRAGEPLGTGIYLVQFKAGLGENVYLSQNFRLQIYT